MNLLFQLTQELLDKRRYKTEASLDELAEMLQKIGYQVQELYTNRRGQVHTIALALVKSKGTKSGLIFLPIVQQYYESELYSTKEGSPDRKAGVTLPELRRFLNTWNEKYPEQALPVSKWLVLEDNCIGLESRGLNLYCQAIKLNSATFRTIDEDAKAQKLYLLHSPEEINKQLASYIPAATLPDPQDLRAKAEEHMRAYWKYVREVMHRIDEDRNSGMRKKVNAALASERKARQKDEALRKLGLGEGDIEKIRASGYRKLEEGKSNTEIYDFDLSHLHNIRKLHSREEIRAYLRKELKLKENVELDLLAADFSNPLRRESLLQAIILEDVGIGAEVKKGPDEEVFISSL